MTIDQPGKGSPDRIGRYLPALALCVAIAGLWVLAGAFYGGDIGKTRDDYTWAVNDPVTGEVQVRDLWRLPLFWRPLSLILVRHLVSLTWDAPWVANLFASLCHLALVIVFYRWMRAMAGGLAAGAAALVFLTMPIGYDVMHWPAAAPTALSGVLALAAVALAMQGPTVRRCVGIGVLTLLACCFNEQAAACVAAAIVLPLAGTQRWRDRATSCLKLAIAIGVPCLLYIVLVVATAPANHRGGASSFVPIHDWPERSAGIASGVWKQLGVPDGRDLLLGGLDVGMASLGLAGAALAILSVLAALAWAWSGPSTEGRPSPRVRLAYMVMGTLWFMLGMTPFLVVQTGPIEARHVYLPALGGLLGIVMLLSIAARPLPCRVGRICGRSVASASVLLAGLMAISLVGVQTTLRARAVFDLAEARAIVALYPKPPADAVILIARASWRAAHTGRTHYDKRFWSAWHMDHIATAVLRAAYRRDDLFGKHRFSVAHGGEERHFDLDGWTTGLSTGPAWDGGQLAPGKIPWDRVVAVRIDEHGNAIPISTLVLQQQDGPDVIIELPDDAGRTASTQPESFPVRLR